MKLTVEQLWVCSYSQMLWQLDSRYNIWGSESSVIHYILFCCFIVQSNIFSPLIYLFLLYFSVITTIKIRLTFDFHWSYDCCRNICLKSGGHRWRATKLFAALRRSDLPFLKSYPTPHAGSCLNSCYVETVLFVKRKTDHWYSEWISRTDALLFVTL